MSTTKKKVQKQENKNVGMAHQKVCKQIKVKVSIQSPIYINTTFYTTGYSSIGVGKTFDGGRHSLKLHIE